MAEQIQNQQKLGVIAGLSAYILWGVFPIYWKLLDDINPIVVLAHRIVWSLVFCLIIILVTKQLRQTRLEFRKTFTNWRSAIGIILASFFISVNWYVFIWAVSNEYVLQASLGYYINPLINILLAFLFLKERFNRKQILSFTFAFIGVFFMTIDYGTFPWVSLILALSFGLYGLIKKVVAVSSLGGLFIETLIVSPIALFLIIQLGSDYSFSVGELSTWLLIGGGIATAIPLLLFATAAKRIPLSLVGFLQYIAPTIMFILGVFVYQEDFNFVQLFAFVFIWIGLIIFTQASSKKVVARKVA
ncbi:EamA family transporter RarD [Alkalihalobacillus pseudalcaliphilus]|uniref:EamA family transporter RarD n=1 Tax=Alkalihalobacillus pseudalcaliphilus TaxID=79884 RepID=UPI00064DBF3A|nr:EamA family transporter RarD [Alkalihalobacillus pseudalcaliphilus]KMK78187.1 transporter [Alkalihalobacillus pseudalcaliphilus]